MEVAIGLLVTAYVIGVVLCLIAGAMLLTENWEYGPEDKERVLGGRLILVALVWPFVLIPVGLYRAWTAANLARFLSEMTKTMTTFREGDDVVSKVAISSVYISITPGNKGKVLSVRPSAVFPLLVQFNGENLLMRLDEVARASHKDNRDPLDLTLDEWQIIDYTLNDYLMMYDEDDVSGVRAKIAAYIKEHKRD